MREIIGNVIVGQSGGPTSVINSSLVGVYKTAVDRGANKVFGMRYGIQGFLQENVIDLSEHIKSELDIELLKRTPSSFLGSCRYKLPEPVYGNEVFEKIFEILNKLEIKHFFYIGGNDSMDTIAKLSKYTEFNGSKIHFVGIPKTIDNDLAITDHTPGFGSAAKYIAAVTKEVIRDSLVYDTDSVTVIEVMGRNAGWLTGASALAKADDSIGPDLIYMPEAIFDTEKFMEHVKEIKKTRKAVVIIVSEGIKLADGRYVCEIDSPVSSVDMFGHKQLVGCSRVLAQMIERELGGKSRAIELSTLQRCAAHMTSRVDITEAFQVGGAAVKASAEGKSGIVITLKRVSDEPYICVTEAHDVNLIANFEKKVPREWINEAGNYVTEEFLNYVRPLIQAELTPVMVEGIPRHLDLKLDK
jgi:6-phosphofructokinase